MQTFGYCTKFTKQSFYCSVSMPPATCMPDFRFDNFGKCLMNVFCTISNNAFRVKFFDAFFDPTKKILPVFQAFTKSYGRSCQTQFFFLVNNNNSQDIVSIFINIPHWVAKNCITMSFKKFQAFRPNKSHHWKTKPFFLITLEESFGTCMVILFKVC